MKRNLLPLAIAFFTSSGALAAPRSFTCVAHDFAMTEIEFVERGEVLQLTIKSKALENVIQGVKYAAPEQGWHYQQLSVDLPLSSCRFSVTERNLFACNPTNVTVTTQELEDPWRPDPGQQTYPLPPQKTELAWISFMMTKETVEFVDGTTAVGFPILTSGYGEAGEFTMQRYNCAAN